MVCRDDTVLFGGESGGNEYSEQAQFGKRWQWYSSIYAASQGDILRFDAVTELSIHSFLTYLTFEKQKLDLETKMINKK